MKHPNSPLTADEIRDGLARLMASPLMTSHAGRKSDLGDSGAGADYTGALDMVCQFKVDVGFPIPELAKTWGTEGNVPSIISDLAVALVTHHLGANEIFRLGTSEEALRFFEENCEEWGRLSLRAPERAAKAEEAEA